MDEDSANHHKERREGTALKIGNGLWVMGQKLKTYDL
jgi:hypothetical protein